MRTVPVSRRTLLGGVAALAALPLAGCGSDSPTIAATELLTAKNVRRRIPDRAAPIGTASAGMAAFGHALCRATATTGGNTVASPLSIAVAFAMARVGARGATAAALDEFFAFPQVGRDEAYNALTRAIITTDGPPPKATKPASGLHTPPPVVALGNALFPAKTFTVHDDYLNTLAAEYGAGVRPVDFTSGSAVGKINAWVSAQTAGRIKQLFTSLDPDTALVIANTVYLRAGWQQLFGGEHPTTTEPFTRTKAAPVRVPMMHAQTSMRTASTADGYRALELPYGSGHPDHQRSDLAMWLILPPSGGNPVDGLAPTALAGIAKGWTNTLLDIAVPKWNFSSELDLRKVMTGMGLGHVFDTGDFSGIADGIVGIAAAVHRATITVDEYGTEAAAATGLAFETMATPPPPNTFHCDRPYAFTIVGGPAQAPLFSGVVNDPSAS